MNIGPSINSNIVSQAAIIHQKNCTKYLLELELFEQFLVWRYTLGSASVNGFLINGKPGPNALHWCYLTFKYWKATKLAHVSRGGDLAVTKRMGDYVGYFKNPEAIRQNPNDVWGFIQTYIGEMRRIVGNCPQVKGDITVYKIASRYPGIPSAGFNFKPTSVPQLPFNSTTLDKGFNFAPFVNMTNISSMETPTGLNTVLFKLLIPSGSGGVLYVPPQLHAYPFEDECILSPGCVFEVTDWRRTTISVIDVNTVRMDVLQKEPFIMGPIYEINEYYPCIGICAKRPLQVDMYDATYKFTGSNSIYS